MVFGNRSCTSNMTVSIVTHNGMENEHDAEAMRSPTQKFRSRGTKIPIVSGYFLGTEQTRGYWILRRFVY